MENSASRAALSTTSTAPVTVIEGAPQVSVTIAPQQSKTPQTYEGPYVDSSSNAQNPGPTDTGVPGAGSRFNFPVGTGDTGGSDTGMPTRAGTGDTTGDPVTGTPPPTHFSVTPSTTEIPRQ
jgi:hypothetical protein